MAQVSPSVTGKVYTVSVRPYFRSGKLRRRAIILLSHLAIIGVGLFFFVPWLWIFSASLKSLDRVLALPVQWLPNPVVWYNYIDAVTKISFGLFMRNTLLISLVNVVGAVISNALVAYAFSRIRWPGRDVIFILILSTMMLPYAVTMVPLFVIFTRVHWVNTFLPLTVPAFFGSAFNIFLLRQFFAGIPTELSDAARIDGCTEWGIFWRIILPLSKPALAAVGIFTFQANYNDLLGPLIYLTDEKLWTLSLGLQKFVGIHEAEWNILMAASVLMILPMVLLFLSAQQVFVRGVITSGLKG